jgi:hypothetical protein
MMQNTMAFWAAYDVPFFGISLKMQLKCFCKRRNDARKVLQ